MTLMLGARPGRPREVGLRGPCQWFVDHEDGTVSYVVRRTAESGLRHGVELAFHADSDDQALAEYEAWSREQYQKVVGRAKRAEKWGPLGQGKMT